MYELQEQPIIDANHSVVTVSLSSSPGGLSQCSEHFLKLYGSVRQSVLQYSLEL